MNKLLMNKKIIAGAIALSISPTFVHADVFNMYTQQGFDLSYNQVAGAINVDSSIGSTIDLGAGTWGVSSTAPFYGLTWTATNGTLIQSPGSYALDTASGTVSAATGPVANDGTMYFNVGANQIAGIIDFAWSTSSGIRVVNVWNVNCNQFGSCTFDTALVPGMENGPFGGFNAAFEISTQPVISGINITTAQAGSDTSFLLDTANIVIDSGHTGAANYEWNINSDSAITGAATTALTGAGANTLTIDPTGGLNGTYTVSVNVTDGSSNVVRADLDITITPFAMPAGDSDDDGTPNASESTNDTDGDGIPDYLDHSIYPTNTTLQTTVADGANSSVMVTSAGTIRIGTTALQKSFNNIKLDNTSTAFGPLLATTDMSADITESSCVGGCFDFEVTSITAGSSVQVVIPLSAAIPQNAVYRKFNPTTSRWFGFTLDSANNIASAPALSSGPTACPAPGDAAYTSGLTVGDYCIQLTIQDNGPNDSDSADGTIADPGGIASTDQSNLENTSPSIDGVGGGWWFLMGIPALIGLRRFANSK